MADLSLEEIMAADLAQERALATIPDAFPATPIGGKGAVAPASTYVDPLEGANAAPVNPV